MRKYHGGTIVPGGFYWNKKEWKIAAVSGEFGKLDEGEWVMVPFLAMVILTLLVSGLFVIFLPLIGFVLVGYVIAQKGYGLIKRKNKRPPSC